MNVNGSIFWPDDVARTVEVYQAWATHPLSHSLLALIAYIDALLPRCGAAHDDIEHQGNNILAVIGYIDTFHRRSVWYLNCIPGHWQLKWEVDIEVDVVFDSEKDNGILGWLTFIESDGDADHRIIRIGRRDVRLGVLSGLFGFVTGKIAPRCDLNGGSGIKGVWLRRQVEMSG